MRREITVEPVTQFVAIVEDVVHGVDVEVDEGKGYVVSQNKISEKTNK